MLNIKLFLNNQEYLLKMNLKLNYFLKVNNLKLKNDSFFNLEDSDSNDFLAAAANTHDLRLIGNLRKWCLFEN